MYCSASTCRDVSCLLTVSCKEQHQKHLGTMCRAGRQWGQANALNSSTPVQNANKKSESRSHRYRQKIENVTKDTRKSNETLLNKLGRKFGNPVRLLKSYETLPWCSNKKSYAVNMEPDRSLIDQTWNSSLPIQKARTGFCIISIILYEPQCFAD